MSPNDIIVEEYESQNDYEIGNFIIKMHLNTFKKVVRQCINKFIDRSILVEIPYIGLQNFEIKLYDETRLGLEVFNNYLNESLGASAVGNVETLNHLINTYVKEHFRLPRSKILREKIDKIDDIMGVEVLVDEIILDEGCVEIKGVIFDY